MGQNVLKIVEDWLLATKDRLKSQLPANYKPIDGQIPFLLAVSGGVDSMVLLDLFHRLSQKSLVTF